MQHTSPQLSDATVSTRYDNETSAKVSPNPQHYGCLLGMSNMLTMIYTLLHSSDFMYFATEPRSLASRVCGRSSELKRPFLLVLSSLPISKMKRVG